MAAPVILGAVLALTAFAGPASTCVVEAEVMEFKGKRPGHRTFRVRIESAEEIGAQKNCSFVQVGKSIDIGTTLPGLQGGDRLRAQLAVGSEPGLSALVTHIFWTEITIINRDPEKFSESESQAESQVFFY